MNNRVPRVNHLIQQELSQIILRELDFSFDTRAFVSQKRSGEEENLFSSHVLVTLTRVETSSNLFQTKVYISVLPENEIKRVFQVLNQRIYGLQQKLNQRLKMRPVPRIKFIEEKKTLEAGRIEEILEKIKKEKK